MSDRLANVFRGLTPAREASDTARTWVFVLAGVCCGVLMVAWLNGVY